MSTREYLNIFRILISREYIVIYNYQNDKKTKKHFIFYFIFGGGWFPYQEIKIIINGNTNTNMSRRMVKESAEIYKNVYSQVVRGVLMFIWRRDYKTWWNKFGNKNIIFFSQIFYFWWATQINDLRYSLHEFG